MSFFEMLEKRILEVDSLLCVGIDPHPDDLQSETIKALRDFCHRIISTTINFAAAYKPNSAFFEAYGPDGISTLKEVISMIPDGIPVILDAKRGDIASTAVAYAKAAFEVLGANAITVNPYLGHDSIEPFLKNANRGVFLLCKTSNPGSDDIQDVVINKPKFYPRGEGDYHIYERVAELGRKWNNLDNLGLVVGATYPDVIARIRGLVPDMWILAPGIGTQGGQLHEVLQVGLRQDEMGLLIPISRGISRADDPAKAANDIRLEVNKERKVFRASVQGKPQLRATGRISNDFALLADGLLEAGCIKFGQFTLKSGMISPIYIDLRQLIAYPGLLDHVASAYLPILEKLAFDRMAGIPYAAIPIATAISIKRGWPFVYPRKEVKAYGTKAEIEGVYTQGERVVIIDDLATTGSSKFEAIEKLTGAGLVVQDVVVMIDRQSGAKESLSEAGFKLHAVTTLDQLLDYYEGSGKVTLDHIIAAREFIAKS